MRGMDSWARASKAKVTAVVQTAAVVLMRVRHQTKAGVLMKVHHRTRVAVQMRVRHLT